MPEIASEIIDLKGGHKLRRVVTEEFIPHCGICKRDVWRYGMPLKIALDILTEHRSVTHGERKPTDATPTS